MDILIEIVQIVLPAGLVLYGMYLMTRSFINREIEKAKLDVKARSVETVF